MDNQRPDLTGLAPEVVAYIEALEGKLASVETESRAARREVSLAPSEPPTTINMVTVSKAGWAKRTPRHLYGRQRRGGMGIFDMDVAEDDQPEFLVVADVSETLIVITNEARAFRLPVSEIAELPLHSRGESILEQFPLRPDEQISIMIPDADAHTAGAYLALVSERGHVRRIGSQYLGRTLKPGTVLYNIAEGGGPAAACWTPGDHEICIATRLGRGIRFAERQVPLRGCLGMRVDPGDQVVAIAAPSAEGGIFMLNEEGKGTIRLMSGFTANKAPGSGGKVAMKTDALVGAFVVEDDYDLFAISKLGKLIRFQAAEVPQKEGVVQGVNCMNLRADICLAIAGCAVAVE